MLPVASDLNTQPLSTMTEAKTDEVRPFSQNKEVFPGTSRTPDGPDYETQHLMGRVGLLRSPRRWVRGKRIIDTISVRNVGASQLVTAVENRQRDSM
jgi:hypothetical protein